MKLGARFAMIVSMTGFGSDVYSNDNFTLETEVKSLNSRFLDLSVRLPKELYSYEFIIRDLVKSKIGRGKVTLSINLIPVSSNNVSSALDVEKLNNTVELLNKISSESKIYDKISINQLLTFKESFLNQSQLD